MEYTFKTYTFQNIYSSLQFLLNLGPSSSWLHILVNGEHGGSWSKPVQMNRKLLDPSADLLTDLLVLSWEKGRAHCQNRIDIRCMIYELAQCYVLHIYKISDNHKLHKMDYKKFFFAQFWYLLNYCSILIALSKQNYECCFSLKWKWKLISSVLYILNESVNKWS